MLNYKKAQIAVNQDILATCYLGLTTLAYIVRFHVIGLIPSNTQE
jgi:hypothetical protein